jgi:uncharacterized pyridoxamine 5'-phosphate oxidase family protein
MKEIVEFLNKNTRGALATVDNGMPRVRPWGFMLEEGGKFYFCTANTKEVFGQLKKNPAVEFTSTSAEMVTVRLSGRAILTDDLTMKKKVLDLNPMVRGIYKTEDNPVFEVFYLEHGEAVISDFSGRPPRRFSF